MILLKFCLLYLSASVTGVASATSVEGEVSATSVSATSVNGEGSTDDSLVNTPLSFTVASSSACSGKTLLL